MAIYRDYILHQMSNHVVLTTKLSWNCSAISKKEFGLSVWSLCRVHIFQLLSPWPAYLPWTPSSLSIKLENREPSLTSDFTANRKRAVALCYLVPFYLALWCRKWTNTLQKNNEWSSYIKVKQGLTSSGLLFKQKPPHKQKLLIYF